MLQAHAAVQLMRARCAASMPARLFTTTTAWLKSHGPHRPRSNAHLRAQNDGAQNDGAQTSHSRSTSLAPASRARRSVAAPSTAHPGGVRQVLSRVEQDAKPRANVPAILSQLVDLIDSPVPGTGGSGAPGEVALKPKPVPASVQASAHDALLRAFDPTGASSRMSRLDSTPTEYLDGREVVSVPGGFELPGSSSSTLPSVNPEDIIHDGAPMVAGHSASKLEAARRASVQASLTELMNTATGYHLRAVERDDALRNALASPLAVRRLPPMSARSESASTWKSRELRELESVFEVLEAKGYPRTIHHTQMLAALGREGFVADAEQIFSDMLASRDDSTRDRYGSFFPDTVTCNAMIGMYDSTLRRFPHAAAEKEAVLDKARGIFRTMTLHHLKPDVITYTSMIHLLAHHATTAPVAVTRNGAIKESLELFEHMQSPQGGLLTPNRRTFSILVQSLAASGDHNSAGLMIEHMMRTYQIFPSLAIMNGLLKATAIGCGRNVPVAVDGETRPKCDVTPIKDVIALMKKLHIAPTEHSVASIIRGLAETGQVQTAKELHDHLKDGSLGTAQPSRLTYTALLSVLVSDHAQPMSTCLATYSEALSMPDIFRSPVKRGGSMFDLRHVGNHPELYPVALTKQLRDFLDKYMELSDEAERMRRENPTVPRDKYDEASVLDQVIPKRGWLILTGRHRGDLESQVKDGQIVHGGYIFEGDVQAGEDLSHLKDEFPDDADYSAWDDTGVLKPTNTQSLKGRAPNRRESARLNTLHSQSISTSFGAAAEKFLLTQTPSIASVITQQFDKTVHKRRDEKTNETKEKSGTDDNAAASASNSASKRRDALEDPPKTSEWNEGMLIVRRPVLHFWLRCHAHVIRWHRKRAESLKRGDERPMSPVVSAPRFLTFSQQGGWWHRLAESIEVQHGLATLQTSREAAEARDQELEREDEQRRARKAAGYRGTRRDGSRVEPNEDARDSDQQSQAKPNWSVRKRPTKARY